MPSTRLSLTAALALGLNCASSFAAPAPSNTVPEGTLSQCAASLNAQLPSPTPPEFHFSGNVRRFYVAAEEVAWNYAPTGWDNWLGVPFDLSPRAQQAGNVQYGQTWLKALYRGYTDATFTERSEQPPWQGTQGPTLRAETGDLIEIMFVNNLSKNYATMHSMGLQYSKYSEGAAYPNNTMPGVNVILPEPEAVPPVDNGIPPGGCVVYKWMVDDVSGPNFGEPAKAHSYHSYVALQQDTNAGLIGPTIIYARGQMERTMASYREFPLLYMIYNENESWLSGENAAVLQNNGSFEQSQGSSAQGQGSSAQGHGRPAQSYGRPGQGHGSSEQGHGGPPNANYGPSEGHSKRQYSGQTLWSGNQSVWEPQLVNLQGAGQFMGAPSFHTINGYVFANNPPYESCFDDNVIWYVNAYGSASHVFHMHGNSFVYNNASEYAISINDGVGKTLYMSASGAGLWQVICHVNNHHTSGMLNNYRVYYPGNCPLTPLEPAPKAIA